MTLCRETRVEYSTKTLHATSLTNVSWFHAFVAYNTMNSETNVGAILVLKLTEHHYTRKKSRAVIIEVVPKLTKYHGHKSLLSYLSG